MGSAREEASAAPGDSGLRDAPRSRRGSRRPPGDPPLPLGSLPRPGGAPGAKAWGAKAGRCLGGSFPTGPALAPRQATVGAFRDAPER